jgi:Ca-activated chloride channel family protein
MMRKALLVEQIPLNTEGRDCDRLAGRPTMEIAPFRRRTRHLPRLVIFFIALVACSFQIPVSAQDQSQDAIRVDVNLVMIDATVKTRGGQIMAGLKKDDFELREDGAAKKIEVFSRDALPLNVALVLDLSDSIGPFLMPLRDAATTALAALKSEDEVALFTFSNEAELSVPFTKDKSTIAQQINTFHTGGATNINDGIFVAAKYLLEAAPKGRRVIILISDDVGTDAGGEGTRDIVTETIAADAALYNLKVPGNNPPGMRFAAGLIPGLVDIHKVTDETGGEIFDVQSMASLDSTFRALIERIKTRYALGYYTSANGAEGKPHKLDVRLASSFGKKGRDYLILAKSGYFIP